MIRQLVRLLVLALLCAAAAAAALAWYATRPLHWTGEAVEYTLRPGTSLRQAALQIEAAGVPVDGRLLGLIGRVAVDGTRLQAGSYAFQAGRSPLQLLEQMTRGDVSLREIRFIEGWTLRQMRAALAAHPDVRHETSALDEQALMSRLGSTAGSAEGWFFPDTYLFPAGESDTDILKRAHHAMRRQLEAAWQKRAPDLPYASPEQALIMASIVEKETGIEADRAKVASVFVNRLRAGMPLQTDPAVIYGLGAGFDGNLTRAHLNTDGPFNTYTRRGLPPTAISAPGRASLDAALNPARTDYLYFVARGDGSSVFSRTLGEHNSAVERYQRRPARVARN